MDFGMILLILAGLAMLVGLVAVFMGHKSWSILTLIFAFLNIVMAVVVLFIGARVLKIHQGWQAEVSKWQDRITKLENETDQVINGNENAEAPEEKIAFGDLRFNLLQAQATRGRAWGIVPNDVAKPLRVQQLARDGKITLIAEVEGGHGIDVGMFVHAFSNILPEDRSGNKVRPTPNDYLGYYRVSLSEEKKVELTRVDRGDAVPATANNQPVLLYETAPADVHGLYAGKTAEELKQLLGNVSDFELWAIQNDNKPVEAIPADVLKELDADIQKLAQNQIWWRMKFTKAFELPKPAAPRVAGAPPVDPDAEKVVEQINEGDVLLLDAVTAAKMQKDGVAEPDGDNYKIFVRPLQDFIAGLSQAANNRERLERAIADSENRTKLNEQTKVTTAAVIASYKATTERLKQDLVQFQTEHRVAEQTERELAAAVINAEMHEQELYTQIAQDGAKLVQSETKVINLLNKLQEAPQN